MKNKVVGYFIIFNIILSFLIPTSLSDQEYSTTWDDNWSFYKEIKIPINTADKNAWNQPIDIFVKFNNSCWAKNKDEHSIRVILQEENKFEELECQIYDLNQNITNPNFLDSCNLIFLIPEGVDGKEKYYVYYDESEKSSPNYPDHVDIDVTFYNYAPLPGISFEANYYKITEEGEIVYAVSLDGEILDDYVTNQVTKLKPGSKNAMPKNGDQVISLDMTYWWKKDGTFKGHEISSAEKLISKEIIVDGNLMIKAGIVSESKDGNIRSTIIYKYYYNPGEDKKLYTHSRHEVKGENLPTGDELDVSYVTFNCGGFKSSNMDDLNFGNIPSYIHLFSEEGEVVEYIIPEPENSKWEEIIGKKEDCDLGSNAWLSIDEGETGKAHGFIFDTNEVVKRGTDERNGIEMQLHEANSIKLPGLDGRFAYIYLTRNDFESGEDFDLQLPCDYYVEFFGEFFTTEEGGYKAVENEAEIFKSLIYYQPKNNESITNDDDNNKKYNLTVNGILSSALKLKLLSSTIFLQNPSVVVELYNNSELRGQGRLGRVPITEDLKIDWRNISLFKNFKFTNFPSGKYLVKLWLENAIFGNKRELIGVEIVELTKDKEIFVYCKPEGKISVSVLDQDGERLENAQIYLLKDGEIISQNISNKEGDVTLTAPCGIKETYKFKIMYKGFLISEEVRLGIIRRYIPLKKSIQINVYDLTVSLRNSEGDILSVNAEISLSSKEMTEQIIITPDNVDKANYRFYNIYPGNFTLNINYNKYEINEEINIPEIKSYIINLYDFKLKIRDNWNLSPDVSLKVKLFSDEFEKDVSIYAEKISSDEFLFTNLYPGTYTINVAYISDPYKEIIKIPNGNNQIHSIIFPTEFNVTNIIYDSHGNILSNVDVIVSRNGINEKGVTDENGKIIFSLPPGIYKCVVYSDGESPTAERNIIVTSEKEITIVTTEEGLINYAIIVLMIILIIGALFYSIKKKDILFFIKIFAIAIVIISLISPWWSVYGSQSNPKIDTSTKMYLVPTKMVIITSTHDVFAGELASLDEEFEFAVSIIPFMITISFLFIMLNIFFNKIKRTKLSFLALFIAFILLCASLTVFYLAITEMTKIIVGSSIGSGNLDISIPGEEMFESVYCNWGFDLGFYLLLISTVLIFIINFFNIKQSLKTLKSKIRKL